MMQVRILIFFIVVFSIGCKPLKNLSPITYSIEKVEKNEFTKLNGLYNDIQDTVFGKIEHYPERARDESNRRLIDRLFINYPDNACNMDTKVDLKFVSNKKAVVTGYLNGTVLFTKQIKGKFKKGYFYVRPKIFIIPFFPIYYSRNFERVRIGKIGDDLIVDHTINSWGFALVAGGADNGLTTSIYKRWKE